MVTYVGLASTRCMIMISLWAVTFVKLLHLTIQYSILEIINNQFLLHKLFFDSKTTTALRQYLNGDDSVTPAFLGVVNAWWLIVNAKERYHPNPIGDAIDSIISYQALLKRE